MAASSRDEVRFAALYEGSRRALRGYVARRLPRGADAEVDDVVADAFLVLWRRLDAVPDDPDEARRWLYRVAHYGVLNARRSLRRRDAALAKVLAAGERVVVADPDRSFLEAFVDLRVEEQRILLLAGVHGLTGQALADALGCSATAAAARLSRARARLRAAGEAEADGLGRRPGCRDVTTLRRSSNTSCGANASVVWTSTSGAANDSDHTRRGTMTKIRQLTGAAAMTVAVMTGSYATASATTSYQGSDYSQDYSSRHNIRNCDQESDSTATKGIYDFNVGQSGTDGNVSDQDGNNGVCASKPTGGTIARHRTCEIPNWWPDECGNWQAT